MNSIVSFHLSNIDLLTLPFCSNIDRKHEKVLVIRSPESIGFHVCL
jgi:hypothetical protein